MEPETEKNEKHESGIMKEIISDLVNGRKIENLEDEKENDEKMVTSEVGNSGGIISNIISKIVYSNNHEVEENEMSVIQTDAKEENGVKNEEHKSGNIIDNIVSHLPSSLTDDMDPPTDEASILIHSIIHD